MTVPARAARQVTVPARLGRRDLRRGSTVPAGAYTLELGSEVVTGWHHHDAHQLEYAFEGVVEVETATARYLLPPRQAIWIPAGVEHCSTLTRVRTTSVFIDPSLGPPGGDRVQVLAASPVLREMIRHARRWPIDRRDSDPGADAFFVALAYLVGDALASPGTDTLLSLPASADPVVAAAMRFTVANLADVTLAGVCAAAGTSERSFRRAFEAATGMSWRTYLLESRILRAMALLAEPGPTVLAVARGVGFDSVSGFTRAFRRYTGETPLAYRRRITAPEPD